MTDRAAAAERLCNKGVVAVVRASNSGQLIDVAQALLAGGVDCIEITMTTPNALEVIADCRKQLDEAFVGVGSVLNAQTAEEAIQAGAQFVVSPIFDPSVIEKSHQHDCPCVPGAFTPTEIHRATEAGADMVKVFPAGMFGPKFFKAVLAPMPHLKLTPTGGVDLDTAGAWIKAGARTLGIGSSLVTKSALASGNFQEITDLAGRYVEIVAEARATKAR
ncbi:MAG: bifunctional 4-hydroxy-2-oxoglutarate aldolase/2-dehydro-3-deoxy-phosphogluconate aldolase [Phycisphaerae bacterium]